jgi:hypothetical protein
MHSLWRETTRNNNQGQQQQRQRQHHGYKLNEMIFNEASTDAVSEAHRYASMH